MVITALVIIEDENPPLDHTSAKLPQLFAFARSIWAPTRPDSPSERMRTPTTGASATMVAITKSP